MLFRVPNRAIKYAVITNYAVRDALKEIDVDLTKVESTLQDTVDELVVKVQSLIERLEAIEENQPDGPTAEDDAKAEAKAKRKAKAKQRSDS